MSASSMYFRLVHYIYILEDPLNAILQIGQFPYRAAGRRGGKPFRGGGRGHFGPRPDGSGPSFRGRGRGGGRGRHFPPNSASTPALMPPPYPSGHGQAPLLAPAQVLSTPVWPPPRMAWCELCRVDCNTPEILEQHKNGKRHKKNLQVYEELQNLNKLLVGGQNEQSKQEVPFQPEKVEGLGNKQAPPENLSSEAVSENKVEIEQQKASEEAERTEEPEKNPRMDHFEARGRGFKRKMRGGRGGKWMRTYEGSRRPFEPPKPKEVTPLVCELCNVKCDSQVVFETHLAGKKHLANLKRFQGHQAMLGQAALQALYPALQALYPALQALYPPNPNAPTSFGPQFPQQGFHGPQDFIAQQGPSMFPQGQASGPATSPALVLETQDQLDFMPQGVTSEGGSQNAATVEAKSQQRPAVNFEAEPAGSNDSKYGNGTSISKGKEVKLPTDNLVVAPSDDTIGGAEEALSGTETDRAGTILESNTGPSDQVVLPGVDSKMEELESKSEDPTE
uniref:U1-type domain-containing protein n=1 Tax=Davidia involucrata TaxID=16924 RepID=A0A5B7BTC0_DAVIN